MQSKLPYPNHTSCSFLTDLKPMIHVIAFKNSKKFLKGSPNAKTYWLPHVKFPHSDSDQYTHGHNRFPQSNGHLEDFIISYDNIINPFVSNKVERGQVERVH